MIKILRDTVDIGLLINEYSKESIEGKILSILNSSSHIYEYNSIGQLKFEVSLRISIIEASRELNNSSLSFKVFDKSKCNPEFWKRTGEGGFLLKEGVEPSDAINDIYNNSSMYGTECSTAILIVYYRALLNIYPKELFNKMFGGLHLMNWHYVDSDLDLDTYENEDDYLPGDCRYFANPDFNPKTPEWQGENAIDLGNGKYYGHGVGIQTADNIVKALNKLRKPGATRTARLLDSATRPNFKYLGNRYLGFLSSQRTLYLSRFSAHRS